MTKTEKRLKRVAMMENILKKKGIEVTKEAHKCTEELMNLANELMKNSFDPPALEIEEIIQKNLYDISRGGQPSNLFDLCLAIKWKGYKDNNEVLKHMEENKELSNFAKIEPSGVLKSWEFHKEQSRQGINEKRIIGEFFLNHVFKKRGYYKANIEIAAETLSDIEQKYDLRPVFGGGTGFLSALYLELCADQSNESAHLQEIQEFFKLGDVDVKLLPCSEEYEYDQKEIAKIKHDITEKLQQAVKKFSDKFSKQHTLEIGDKTYLIQPVEHGFRREIVLGSEKSTTYYYPKEVSPWELDSIDLYEDDKLVSIIFRTFLLVNVVDAEQEHLQKKLEIEFLDISLPIKKNHVLPDVDVVSSCINYYNKEDDYLKTSPNNLMKIIKSIEAHNVKLSESKQSTENSSKHSIKMLNL